MFQRKRKVTPETACMQLFNSDERRQEVNGNARVDYLSRSFYFTASILFFALERVENFSLKSRINKLLIKQL